MAANLPSRQPFHNIDLETVLRNAQEERGRWCQTRGNQTAPREAAAAAPSPETLPGRWGEWGLPMAHNPPMGAPHSHELMDTVHKADPLPPDGSALQCGLCSRTFP